MKHISTLIPNLITLLQNVGNEIISVYQQSRQYPIKAKADNSPQTQADLIANSLITSTLQTLTPDLPILSEEGTPIPWEERQTWQRYWLIDPLDGTLPFIHHTGEFCSNIALIENHQPILGIIYVPVTEECYYGFVNGGSYKRDANGHIHPIKARKWHSDETVILASHGAVKEKLDLRFAHLGNYSVTPLSSAWKFCMLAEGKADLSPRFGDTSEWDTAAGQCILEQAGGGIFDLKGHPLRYNTKDNLLNPHFLALGDVEGLYPLMPWER